MRLGEVLCLDRPWEVRATSASTGLQMDMVTSGEWERGMTISSTYRIFAGIDWGSVGHQVWVTNDAGECVGERVVAHTGAALIELAEWLVTLAEGDPMAVAVCLEVPRGPIVDTLLERGCHVFAINPKQLDRFRDRFSASGAKDDRRDARVLSSAVHTDRAALHRLQIDDPLTVELREYSRQDLELTEDLARLANRLRDHLQRMWPEVLALSPAADDPWFWTLLELAPSPMAALSLRPARIRQLLQEHRIRRVTPETVLTVLRRPSVRLAPGVREGVAIRIADLIEQLRVVSAQRKKSERRLRTMLETIGRQSPDAQTIREHADVAIVLSLPGIGIRIASTMLAEAAQPLRSRDYHALRVLAGIAPVTKRSGKTCVVTMRYACDHRLQRAMYLWAQCALKKDALSRIHHADLRRRGHSNARALRGIADRLLAVLIATLKHDTLYDETRRRARPAA
jgi:transposase